MRHVRQRRLVWDRERNRFYPIPAGGDEPDPKDDKGDKGGDGNGDPSGGGNGGTDDEPRTVTQSQLSAMLAREKHQGRAAAEAAVAEELGMSVKEAKEVLAAARAAEDAQKSEAQRAKEAADAERKAAETEKASAAQERHATRVERALIRAGIDPDDGDRLETVARMVAAEVGSEPDAIATEVETLKGKFPELFGAVPEGNGNGRKPPPSSDPQGRPPKTTATDEAYKRGAERAKQHQTKAGVRYDATTGA